MQDLAAMLVDSWYKQAEIVNRLAEKVDSRTMLYKPADDSGPVHRQLCHIHATRAGWLNTVNPESSSSWKDVFYVDESENYHPINDLPAIWAALKKSETEIGETVQARLADGGPVGPYENIVMFLQHMVWHEGWHYGQIALAFRKAGDELPEEWEEKNVWEIWRGPEE